MTSAEDAQLDVVFSILLAAEKSSSVGDMFYSDISLPNQSAKAEAGAIISSIELRDGARITLIPPHLKQDISIPLDMKGSYFYANLIGEPVIKDGSKSRILEKGKLHILRRAAPSQSTNTNPQFIEFSETNSLSILVFFSSKWRQLCPQGPNCEVGQFLLSGSAKDEDASHQKIDLEGTGLKLSKAILDLHLDEDVDALSAEQFVLGLLSWAFTKDKLPELSRSTKSNLHPKLSIKIRQAADILRQRLDDPPTISQLSDLVGLNESDLKRRFKDLYGNTIASYSRQKRLEAACNLLLHSSLGVSPIALEVGFSNPSQFARAFRQQFGLNPSEYRRSRN